MFTYRRAVVDLAHRLGVRGYKKHLIPTLKEMRARQERLGERIMPQRNALIEWDFSRELNALCKRLSIERTESMATAFITQGYAEEEDVRRSNLGLESAPLQSNAHLAGEGLVALREVLNKQLRECYLFLPVQAIDCLRDQLCSEDTLADVASQMGLQPFVFREGHGLEVQPGMLRDSLLALFATVSDKESFCRRFILIQLCGKDVFDMWNPTDVSFLLNALLKQQKFPPYEARIIGEAGRNTLESIFFVGVYSNQKLLGKGAGTTQAQAVDVAVRDALRRAFRVTRAERSPFERMAMQQLATKITHGPVDRTASLTTPPRLGTESIDDRATS